MKLVSDAMGKTRIVVFAEQNFVSYPDQSPKGHTGFEIKADH